MESIGLTRVCVIGAGPAGLAASKALADRRVPVDCFEKSDRVGGLWTLTTALGKTSAYRSLHINTSRERTQFRDFPMPEHFPDYPHCSQIASYLEQYAERFDLKSNIQLNTEVRHVAQLPDGTFSVHLGTGEQRRYQAVIVANGHHSDPYRPPLPGRFDGVQLHSAEYLDPDAPVRLRDRRVLVVGLGNSAMDIASELAYAGSAVTVSARRGAYIIPKWLLGKPVDQGSLLPRWLPTGLRTRLNQQLFELWFGKLEDYGLPKPDHRLGEAHPTVSSEFLGLLRTKRITIKPSVESLEPTGAVFSDGTATACDVLIFCTGYNVRFPFFDPEFVSAPDNELPLFLRVCKPDVANLYFIGLCQPVGAIFPIAEAQAQWVAELISGSCRLPDPDEVRRRTAEDNQRRISRYVQSRRHTMQVDVDGYLTELAKERARGHRRASKDPARKAEPERPRSSGPSGRASPTEYSQPTE